MERSWYGGYYVMRVLMLVVIVFCVVVCKICVVLVFMVLIMCLLMEVLLDRLFGMVLSVFRVFGVRVVLLIQLKVVLLVRIQLVLINYWVVVMKNFVLLEGCFLRKLFGIVIVLVLFFMKFLVISVLCMGKFLYSDVKMVLVYLLNC